VLDNIGADEPVINLGVAQEIPRNKPIVGADNARRSIAVVVGLWRRLPRGIQFSPDFYILRSANRWRHSDEYGQKRNGHTQRSGFESDADP
jgi:hypothetical protein